MTLERKYGVLFALVVSAVGIACSQLLRTYSWGIRTLIFNQCSVPWTILFRSGFHVVGLFLLSVSLASMAVLLVVLISSLLKASRRKQYSYLRTTRSWPLRLRQVVSHYRIPVESIVFTDCTQQQAYAIGVWQPTLVISRGLVDALSWHQLAAVVLHEYYHIRHRHPGYILAAELMKKTFFFLPVLYDVVLRMKYRFEVAADAYASAVLGTTQYVEEALRSVIPTKQHSWIAAFVSDDTSHRHAPAWDYHSSHRLVISIVTVIGAVTLLWWPNSASASVSPYREDVMSIAPRQCEALTATTNVTMSRFP